jgi:hypothetical protein
MLEDVIIIVMILGLSAVAVFITIYLNEIKFRELVEHKIMGF